MAIPFLNNISLNNNEIQNVKLHNTANIPAPSPGHIYFDTDDNIAKYWNGSAWIDIVSNTNDYLNSLSFDTSDGVLTATIQNQSDVTIDLDGRYALASDIPTYTLTTVDGPSNDADIVLTPSSGTPDLVTIQGVTNETTVDASSDTITVGLPDNVIIQETLTLGGNLTVNTTGVSNNLKLTSTDTTLTGAPDIVLFADAAAQDGDTLGTLLFQGKNGMVPSSTTPLTYAGFFSHMSDSSNNHSILALSMHKGNGPGAQNTAMNFSLIGDNNSAKGALYINPPSGYDFPTHNLEVNGTSRFVDDATFNSNVTVDGNLTVTGTVTTVNETVKVVENNTIEFEGTTDNEFEIKLTGGDPTADHTVSLPNASGTIALLDDINDATLTVEGTNGLTGSGTFTANDADATTITISHADTSSQASVNNSGRTYIQDITLDTYGHVTGITSATETVTDTQLATAAALIDVSAMGSNTTASFTHSLASKNLIVQMYDVTTGEVVFADVDHTSINSISIIFAQTPTNDIRVVVIDAKNSVVDSTVTYS
jgi:hypothetical protein